MSPNERPVSREVVDLQFQVINDKLDEILKQAKMTNGRVSRAEDDIIRLQERANPWTAGGLSSLLALGLGALYEFFKKS